MKLVHSLLAVICIAALVHNAFSLSSWPLKFKRLFHCLGDPPVKDDFNSGQTPDTHQGGPAEAESVLTLDIQPKATGPDSDEAYGLGDPINEAFARLAERVFQSKTRGALSKEAKKNVKAAASIMLSISLASGLVTGDSKKLSNFFTHSEIEEIAKSLRLCFRSDTLGRVAQKYNRDKTEGNNPIVVMSAALEAVAHEDSPVHGQRRKSLGCEFDDEKFSYRRPNDTTRREKRYAHEAPPRLRLYRKEEVQRLMQVLPEVSKRVMERSRLNDVNELIRFLSHFKGQTKSLTDFYKSYKFRPSDETTAVFEREFIEQMKVYYPDIENYFYLVSKHFDDFDTRRQEIQDTVAGAFRILIDGRRRGYVLVELNYGLSTPILMEDKQWPDIRAISQQRKGIEFVLINDNEPRAEARFYGLAPKAEPMDENIHYNGCPSEDVFTIYRTKFHYNIGKPYCAFMEFTYKPNLLKLGHGMITWQKFGPKSAQLSFKVMPKKHLPSPAKSYFFKMVSYLGLTGKELDEAMEYPNSFKVMEDNTYYTYNSDQVIQFDQLKEIDKDKKKYNYFTEVARKLRIDKDILWAKLYAVKILLFDDDELVKKIFTLNQELHWGSGSGRFGK